MGDTLNLGRFEERVLLTVVRLGDNAYGVPIRQAVEEAEGRHISIGAIYTTLERLMQKGYVSSRLGEVTPERGGRAKRYFAITGTGAQALADADRVRALLGSGLQPAGGIA